MPKQKQVTYYHCNDYSFIRRIFLIQNAIGLFQDGYTALHLAVECGKPQVVQMLLGYGAQVEFKGGKVSYIQSTLLAQFNSSKHELSLY